GRWLTPAACGRDPDDGLERDALSGRPRVGAPACKREGPGHLRAVRGLADVLRTFAAGAWCALLAGYLIFNKPFAALGVHPVYVGELTLGLALLALASRFRAVFVEPLQRSWTFRLIALFCVYGLIRAALGVPRYGSWAVRDGVIAIYAVAAFIAPALWGELVRGPDATTHPVAQAAPGPFSRAAFWLLPASLVAALWSLAALEGWAPAQALRGVKVDLLAVSAAIAGWVWFTAAAKWCPYSSLATRHSSLVTRHSSLVAAALALGGVWLMLELPVRAVWLSLGPLALVAVAALAHTWRRRVALGAGVGVLALLAWAWLGAGPLEVFARVDRKYALGANLDAPIEKPETQSQVTPENSGTLVLDNPTGKTAKEVGERLGSLLNTDLQRFETEAGRLGALSVEWRAAFWVRCVRYTLHNASLFGIGFGPNLTNLLRETPAWPLYLDSMRLDPPNRNPHCAHITIFTRLGLVGVALWVGILASVCWSVLAALWRCRERAQSGAAAEARAEFWDMLAVFGVWVIFLWAMSFGVILEGPMGGIWFWSVTGALAMWSDAWARRPAC
ncbi:MAG: hypothetical protein NTW87_30980, partial [Planctomycetota bacterium]|nr:hypothetical protein [Planctomycetota bacterium]